MSATSSWTAALIEAAEARGYVVTSIDLRAHAVTLEEPTGSAGLQIRIQGRDLDDHFVRQLPEAVHWADLPTRVRSMPDGSPCWCVSDHDPRIVDGWVHAPACLAYRLEAGV